jgi:hypothetical protein
MYKLLSTYFTCYKNKPHNKPIKLGILKRVRNCISETMIWFWWNYIIKLVNKIISKSIGIITKYKQITRWRREVSMEFWEMEKEQNSKPGLILRFFKKCSYACTHKVVRITTVVLWVMAPCSFTGRYRHFWGSDTFHLQNKRWKKKVPLQLWYLLIKWQCHASDTTVIWEKLYHIKNTSIWIKENPLKLKMLVNNHRAKIRQLCEQTECLQIQDEHLRGYWDRCSSKE